MNSLTSYFQKPYSTALDIEFIDNIEDILKIPPDQINTTDIIADDMFREISKGKQAAIRFIHRQIEMRDRGFFNYPPPNKMLELFKRSKEFNKDVEDEITKAALLDNSERFEDLKVRGRFLDNRREGGKKRQRTKRRLTKRRRRKSQRR
jgi:hypothetical protein